MIQLSFKPKRQSLTLLEACRLSNFVLAHYPPARSWIDPVGWAAFHLSHGFVSTVHAENDDIVACAVARPVENPGDGAVAYRFDELGECLFVDLMIVPNTMPEAMWVFHQIAVQRFGKPERIAFFRGEESALRVFDYDKWVKKLKRE